VATVPKAAKVAALQANPKVALTIDKGAFPPKVPLLRCTRQQNMMAKYLFLKHYRDGPAPTVPFASMDQWAPDEVDAHLRYMRDFMVRLKER
jgi:hypothetical protein